MTTLPTEVVTTLPTAFSAVIPAVVAATALITVVTSEITAGAVIRIASGLTVGAIPELATVRETLLTPIREVITVASAASSSSPVSALAVLFFAAIGLIVFRGLKTPLWLFRHILYTSF